MIQEILYIPDVAKLLGKSESAIQSMVARGDLPAAFSLGRRTAWKRSAIMAWIDAQEAEAQAKRKTKKNRSGRKRLPVDV